MLSVVESQPRCAVKAHRGLPNGGGVLGTVVILHETREDETTYPETDSGTFNPMIANPRSWIN